MYKLFLSLRYFRSRPINIIPVICMTLGVMALIVIIAVMDGFQAQLRATLRGTLSDVMVQVHYESDFEAWEQVLMTIDGVVAVAPHLNGFALVAEIPKDAPPGQRPPQARMDFALALGIEPDREAEVSSFRKYLLWRERAEALFAPRDGVWQPTIEEGTEVGRGGEIGRVDGEPVRSYSDVTMTVRKFMVEPGETVGRLQELAQVERDWQMSTPDPERPFAVFNRRWEDRPGVILGRRLALKLNARKPRFVMGEGDDAVWEYSRVYLTTMVRNEEGAKELYRAQQWVFAVTGIYESGNQETDGHIAYVERSVAKEFFEIASDPEEIRIHLDDYQARWPEVKAHLMDREVMREIYQATARNPGDWDFEHYNAYTVSTWEDERRIFLNAIKNEKGLIAIIAGMAFLVTGFMIFAILSMIVTMKTRDIGILKALGATTDGILKIFVLNGLIVGVVGSLGGLGLGVLFTNNINWIRWKIHELFGWELFPQDIYLFSEIPTKLNPGEVFVITVSALLVALVGAILPALRAARLDAVESLRYE
jgi:lipoprotein-releasing system permease protein